MPIPDFQSLMLPMMSVAEIFDDDFPILHGLQLCGHRLFSTTCGAGLLASSCALTFLQAHSKGFNLFLLRVNLATCFEELVEQHGVHLVVAHAVGFSLLSGSTSAGFTFATSSAIKPNCGVPLVSVL